MAHKVHIQTISGYSGSVDDIPIWLSEAMIIPEAPTLEGKDMYIELNSKAKQVVLTPLSIDTGQNVFPAPERAILIRYNNVIIEVDPIVVEDMLPEIDPGLYRVVKWSTIGGKEKEDRAFKLAIKNLPDKSKEAAKQFYGVQDEDVKVSITSWDYYNYSSPINKQIGKTGVSAYARYYQDGETIPRDLPTAYRHYMEEPIVNPDNSNDYGACGSCQFNNDGACSKYNDAAIKATWVCNKGKWAFTYIAD